MNLSCLTCQGMKRTDSFADMERNIHGEKADNINKLLDGVDNRTWSGNIANNSGKEKNSTNDNTTVPKKPTNPSRQFPVHSSGPLTTNAMAIRFARSSSSSSRRAPVHRSGPLNRTNTTTATGARLFGESSSSSSPRPVQVHNSSGPLNLQAAAAAETPAGPPKLVRCGGMRRDWSFEDLRQMNSLKT